MKYVVKKRGFTLIELLVVIVIITVLAAIAMPQYKRAVARAETWKELQSVLIPMSRAGEMFILEHGTFPATFADFEKYDVHIPWTGTKKGYPYGVNHWRSQGDWSINIFTYGSSPAYAHIGYSVFLCRVSGKYSGVCFTYYFTRPLGDLPEKQLFCEEVPNNRADTPKFGGKQGDFCQKVMKGKQWKNTQYYIL